MKEESKVFCTIGIKKDLFKAWALVSSELSIGFTDAIDNHKNFSVVLEYNEENRNVEISFIDTNRQTIEKDLQDLINKRDEKALQREIDIEEEYEKFKKFMTEFMSKEDRGCFSEGKNTKEAPQEEKTDPNLTLLRSALEFVYRSH